MRTVSNLQNVEQWNYVQSSLTIFFIFLGDWKHKIYVLSTKKHFFSKHIAEFFKRSMNITINAGGISYTFWTGLRIIVLSLVTWTIEDVTNVMRSVLK